MLWGPRDPVFGERYLADLRERLPQARLHRYEGASHLVTEDAPQYAAAVAQWVRDLDEPTPPPAPAAPEGGRRLWSALTERADDLSPAVVEVGGATVSWYALHRRVRELAAGLAAAGLRPGHRVALLVEPSADLTAAVYAVWRAGGVVVVADKGLGFAGMRRALRSASVDHVIGAAPGLAAARLMGLPGSRIAVGSPGPVQRRSLGVDHDLDGLALAGSVLPLPEEPSLDADCALVFTSGATGPAKGVVYRHRQVSAQLDLLRAPTRSRPRTGWWRRSPRSRSSVRPWASAPRCPTSTSPRRAPSPRPGWRTPSRPSTPPWCSPPPPPCATSPRRPPPSPARSGPPWAGCGC